MASASSKVGGLAVAIRVVVPVALGSAGYAAYKINWRAAMHRFVTGPGRSSRILLLLFVVLNWKNMPLAWTYRVFYAIVYHNILRKSPDLTPRALFKPLVSETRAPLLEIDYNLHKSNSTYFTDMDVSRSHLVSYLTRRAMRSLALNSRTGLVLDPQTGRPARGAMGVMLGSVSCSFKREIGAYRPYELWSRVLAWDRKWLYMVTHFVPRGAAKPTEWLDPRFGGAGTRGGADAPAGRDAGIHASAVARYVFKLGRLSVHPAVVLAESGLLPPRPGGWTSGENQVGDEAADVGHVDLAVDGDWDWARVEAQRRRGIEVARHFARLDECHDLFDGGAHGALAKIGPC
ncbi:capsule polysaccharide biosynthesis protein [Metarhizium album ARSEF 1941]|uniref:Capsule polysaccharide biosynthesis protein n=1 Tax=Metarhizium album (strain ARSEF 1941) TaxID=1081103 RepID=A0A0B2WUD4_METAS|nr:capsule polysaccharide biosynthesis protein [Metarhizium album ARSEF 1941]KHN96540.1 capsule polysaccharide biosynthesis protein [Metarhizium album ARSEF 1941]